MQEQNRHATLSPLARSAASCVAGLTIALLVCVITYLLREADFGPLRSLIAFEDSIYDGLILPPIEPAADFHRVVVLDIDAEAVRVWNVSRGVSNETPRDLISSTLRVAREGGASTIFLDFDLRNQRPEDTALRDEIAHSVSPLILMPRSFTESGAPVACNNQAEADAPFEYGTPFDGIPSAPITIVHSVVELGTYGLVESFCPWYLVHKNGSDETVARQAAMLQAVSWARLGTPSLSFDFDRNDELLQARSIRWRIKDDTDRLFDTRGKLIYARIRVSSLLNGPRIDTNDVDLSSLRDAIVIIGASHKWADDFHDTPVGRLSGAVIQGNIGLELQSPPQYNAPVFLQFTVDLLLAVLAAGVAIPCWLPLFRGTPPDRRPGFRQRLKHLLRETAVVLSIGIGIFVSYLILSRNFGGFLTGWRFGVLTFLLTTAVVLAIELVTAVADAASEGTEWVLRRLSGLDPDQSGASKQTSTAKPEGGKP